MTKKKINWFENFNLVWKFQPSLKNLNWFKKNKPKKKKQTTTYTYQYTVSWMWQSYWLSYSLSVLWYSPLIFLWDFQLISEWFNLHFTSKSAPLHVQCSYIFYVLHYQQTFWAIYMHKYCLLRIYSVTLYWLCFRCPQMCSLSLFTHLSKRLLRVDGHRPHLKRFSFLLHFRDIGGSVHFNQ